MEFHAKINEQGNGFEFPPRGKRIFLEYAKKNAGRRILIKDIVPESRDQREFYHGAVLALWAYLDGNDYKDSSVIADYHEIAKLEFNAKVVNTRKGQKKIGQTSKGKLREGFLNRVIDYLEEEYGVERELCLDPKHYKDFLDRIYMHGQYEDYLSYLQDLKRVPVIHK